VSGIRGHIKIPAGGLVTNKQIGEKCCVRGRLEVIYQNPISRHFIQDRRSNLEVRDVCAFEDDLYRQCVIVNVWASTVDASHRGKDITIWSVWHKDRLKKDTSGPAAGWAKTPTTQKG
jgi:hypothetical protein